MYKKFLKRITPYKLTIIGGFSIVILVIIIIGVFTLLALTSIATARSNRGQLIERDLKDIAGQFDADERYVLEKNLNAFLSSTRKFYPLLLPRQYYVSLPRGASGFVPRPPPQNCYIKLIKASELTNNPEKFPDKFCAYFAENSNFGKYLFFSLAVVDRDVTPLKKGDISLSADSIILTVDNGHTKGKWWLFMQPSKNVSAPGRFQITAYRERPNRVMELDKSMEGWSYVQKQANDTNVINILTRLDFKEFVETTDNNWPPSDWQNITLGVSRLDWERNSLNRINYQDFGNAYLSIPSLASSIFNSYATLQIITPQKSVIIPPSDGSQATTNEDDFIKFVDGDMLVRRKPLLERSQLFQDTNITLKAIHPGTVVEKIIWQSIGGLGIILIFFAVLAVYIFSQILKPLFVLSKRSRLMVADEMANLPYSNLNNEIGMLSRGFNQLLRETKEQVVRRREEIENQEKESRRKHEEDIKSKEITLKFIGHEIRSPLQSLTSLHKTGPSKRYIDRMTYAIKTLENISGPESIFSNRQFFREKVELNFFLKELAENCELAGIPDVNYEGTLRDQISVMLDPSVLEDAITHILTNANHHRRANTPIIIKLRRDVDKAIIDIINDGPHIKEGDQEKIFDLYHSSKNQVEGELNGIGLYVCRQYMSGMNGTIQVSNEIFGVNFTLTLPIYLSEI